MIQMGGYGNRVRRENSQKTCKSDQARADIKAAKGAYVRLNLP